jgi:hypothetical protein
VDQAIVKKFWKLFAQLKLLRKWKEMKVIGRQTKTTKVRRVKTRGQGRDRGNIQRRMINREIKEIREDRANREITPKILVDAAGHAEMIPKMRMISRANKARMRKVPK